MKAYQDTSRSTLDTSNVHKYNYAIVLRPHRLYVDYTYHRDYSSGSH
jgi:hypothetical protein